MLWHRSEENPPGLHRIDPPLLKASPRLLWDLAQADGDGAGGGGASPGGI